MYTPVTATPLQAMRSPSTFQLHTYKIMSPTRSHNFPLSLSNLTLVSTTVLIPRTICLQPPERPASSIIPLIPLYVLRTIALTFRSQFLLPITAHHSLSSFAAHIYPFCSFSVSSHRFPPSPYAHSFHGTFLCFHPFITVLTSYVDFYICISTGASTRLEYTLSSNFSRVINFYDMLVAHSKFIPEAPT